MGTFMMSFLYTGCHNTPLMRMPRVETKFQLHYFFKLAQPSSYVLTPISLSQKVNSGIVLPIKIKRLPLTPMPSLFVTIISIFWDDGFQILHYLIISRSTVTWSSTASLILTPSPGPDGTLMVPSGLMANGGSMRSLSQ